MRQTSILILIVVAFAWSALGPVAAAEPAFGRVLVTQAALSALAALPADAKAQPLSAFYARYQPYLEAHSGTTNFLERMDQEERPQNFIDLDALGTAPAFAEIPHDYDAAVTKFGVVKLRTSGTAPWALSQHFRQLVYAFQNRDLPAILLHSARIDAYCFALHQPFHTTKNYDGMATGQFGIHSRFEGLPERRKMTASDLKVGVPTIITRLPEIGFTWATQSWGQVAVVLAADKASQAAPPGTKPDDFFDAQALPVMRTQLSQAATDYASLLYSAWTRAGQPALPEEINPSKAPVKVVP